MGLTALGLLAGTAIGFLGSRLLAADLFETASADPVSLLATAALLLAIALLACLIPGMRAARVQPVEARSAM